MSIQFLSRDCHACGTSATKCLPDTASTPTAEASGYESLVPIWNGFFKKKLFFSYCRCSSCGLLYAPVFFTPKQLEALYAQMPPNMDVVPMDALRKTQRGYFETMQSASPPDGDYIEVGPDIGLFTENCVRKSSFQKYWLLEPNRNVAASLSAAMQDKPHEIIHDMFGFSNVPDSAAGAAVMIHVLDHLLDPVATLKELRQKLKPGSVVAIVTHDESSLLRRIFKKRWPPFCLQHPAIYNPKSITHLLDRAGYDVIQIRKTVNYFPLQFLLRHLLWALGLKVKSVPTFGGLTLGLKLGNMITIATQKAV